MDQNAPVDANRVIAALNERLAAATLQNAILEVALADAQEKYALLMAELHKAQLAKDDASGQ